jgi:hypothetical protein
MPPPRLIPPPRLKPPPRPLLGLIPLLRPIERPEEREGEGAEIERDRELLGRLDPTLRLLLREILGDELCTREELLDSARLREKLPRGEVDRETRESVFRELFPERLIRAELAAVRDRAASSPRLDGLTREAARGANRPEELPWSAREARAEVERLEPNRVNPLSLEPRSSDRDRPRLERLLLPPPPPRSADGAERGALRLTEGARLGAERCGLGAARCCRVGAER